MSFDTGQASLASLLTSTSGKFTIQAVYKNLLDFICTLSEWICGVSLVTLTVIFGWLVYGRYVLNATPTWVEQVSLLLIVLIGFLGASVGVWKKSHLGVSYFRELSPAPVQRLFEFIAYLVLGCFGAIMMVYSYRLTLFKWGSEIPLIHIPEGVRAIPIVLCGGLTMLYCIGHLWELLMPSEESADAEHQ